MRGLLYAAALAPLVLGGCVSISGFQSGDVVAQGALDAGMGVGGDSINTKSNLLDFDSDMPSLTLEGWARYGLAQSWDIGVKIALPGYVLLDVRHALIRQQDGRGVSAALWAGYGLSSAEASAQSSSKSIEDKTRIQDTVVGLSLSRQVKPWLSLYATPRVIWRQTRNRRRQTNQPETMERFEDILAGGGLGLMFSSDHDTRFFLEVDQVVDVDESRHRQSFIGIGASVRFSDIF